jgi:hypothetical protein
MKTTLETSGEDVKTTLETSGEDVTFFINEREFFGIGRSVFLRFLPSTNITPKIHSKRVEKMQTHTRSGWRR